jgi:hypothetical protein
MNFLIGADPEVFLTRRNTREFASIIGKIGANKWNPKQIEGLPDGFTLQEDNVALEFGVPPASSADEFVFNVRKVMQEGLRALPGEKFSRLSCVRFPKEELAHPSAHVFGCEPDYNAWTLQENPRPETPTPETRSAGGHVHIGYNSSLTKHDVIRACDLVLGVPSVLMDKAGAERRSIYGKAGAFRPKPYGAEYRTLSNFWIFKPQLIRWVYRGVGKALELAENPEQLAFFRDEIQHAINTGCEEEAKFLVKEFSLEVI